MYKPKIIKKLYKSCLHNLIFSLQQSTHHQHRHKYNLELQYSIHLSHHNNPGVISPVFLCRLYGCVCLCKICSVYETDVKINMTDKTMYYIHTMYRLNDTRVRLSFQYTLSEDIFVYKKKVILFYEPV